MTWGYALIWAGQYMTLDEDPLLAKLKWLDKYNLKTTGSSPQELTAKKPEKLAEIGEFLAERGMELTLALWPNTMQDDVSEVHREIDTLLMHAESLTKVVPIAISTTGVAKYHRFMDSPNIHQQMDRLSEVLPHLAKGCAELDIPLAIENHGDYYVSDLVPLCREIEDLYMFLDTGNVFLIGEQALPAYELAAPYTIGGHFKDHKVRPVPNGTPLHFEVGASIIGEGHAPLRECFELLKAHAPRWDRLTMQIELIQPSFSGDDPIHAFEASLEFVKSLGDKGSSVSTLEVGSR